MSTIHPSTYGPEEADPFAPVDLRERDRIELDELARYRLRPTDAQMIDSAFAEFGIKRGS